jgi:tRNA1Val (adenine37-N6)-methyltransferase
MDPFVLSAHIKPHPNEKIIDIGTGCGIIPLILSSRYPGLKIIGVEIQKELYQFARKNVLAQKLEKTINLINKDISDVTLKNIFGPADVIVSNPPYKKRGSGRLNPDSQKAIARHEIHLDIDMLFKYAKALLKDQGRLYIIFPAERLKDLESSMTKNHFNTSFMRFLHIKKGSPAKRVILCAVKNQETAPCNILPPLYIYSDKDQYTSEYFSVVQPMMNSDQTYN